MTTEEPQAQGPQTQETPKAESPDKRPRTAGVYVIIAKNADGKVIWGEKPSKKETLEAIEQIGGMSHILAVYRGARRIAVKEEVRRTINFE